MHIKGMSRAKKADKRSITVRVYVSKEEARMTKRQAEDLGLSVPMYIRTLIRRGSEDEKKRQ
jgi:prolyl-tRNA editing enzyme YbaK/EbsC (Cys-tRNA(Pro) deacylase)